MLMSCQNGPFYVWKGPSFSKDKSTVNVYTRQRSRSSAGPATVTGAPRQQDTSVPGEDALRGDVAPEGTENSKARSGTCEAVSSKTQKHG